ncbi:DUF4864 domain-containing protein [Nisaea sp.]|uniref:DUF4864 domain-containing protein n=1 Tax=Nisaea sp. TaxID=2024842 RepID=UPI0032EBE5A6
MRSLIFCLVLLAGLYAGTPGNAWSAEPASGDDIRSTISRQLEAFQRDDWAGAFAFASPVLQTIFGSPERFRAMVLRGYRTVYRPKQVTFRDLDSSGPQPVQMVFFIGPDGLAYLAAYEMEQQADGSWRIAGVQMIRAEAKSA